METKVTSCIVRYPIFHRIRNNPNYFIFKRGEYWSACAVYTNLPPVFVALFLGAVATISAQSESRLTLEQKSNPPFQTGDRLEIQSDATVFSSLTRITVLNTAHWPWVRVRSEQGEAWLNFDHVVIAKTVASTK